LFAAVRQVIVVQAETEAFVALIQGLAEATRYYEMEGIRRFKLEAFVAKNRRPAEAIRCYEMEAFEALKRRLLEALIAINAD
jgi:L-alanine-DL-glutamate epimerase-like enolase superfamily enzyme